MDELKNRPEPKKLKLTPLVDRSKECDTLSFDSDEWHNAGTNTERINENNRKNNSESISKLESQ